MASSGFRELTVSADSIFKLLQRISTGRPIRVDRDPISQRAGLAAGWSVDEQRRLITLKVVDQWRDAEDPTAPLKLIYTERVTDRGDASDWGTPILLTEPTRSAQQERTQ